MSKTLDDRGQFIELRARGYSFSKISEELEISKPTLIEWSKDNNVSEEVHNLRMLMIDELQEKYMMTKKHRIAVFGDFLNRVKTELEKRELSEVSTDKLIALVIRLSDALKQDETEIELVSEEPLSVGSFTELKRWVA
ncbi:hypothetical protein KKE14_03255 [Patescibacteria group bacterium]|nr:hypothetical protein [Patescibacteria group bacterium]